MKIKNSQIIKMKSLHSYQFLLLFILIMSITISHIGVIPVIADSYEPDNSIDTANILVHDSIQTHAINPAADIDYFNFTITQLSEVSIMTSGPSGDTYMMLYNSEGTLVDYNDEYDGSWAGLLVYLDPGIYSVAIEAYYSFDIINSYNIHLLVSPLSADTYESDDTAATATSLIVDVSQLHNLVPIGDVDYYSIILSQPEVIKIWTSGTSDMLADTKMWLYDVNMVEMDYNDDIEYSDGYSGLSISLEAGTYYVEVSEYYFAAYGEYYIQYTLLPQPDNYEPNNSQDTATPLLPGITQFHNLSPSSDLDYFSFSTDSFAKVDIWTAGTLGDTFMILSDSNDVIESNNDYSGLWAGMEVYLDSGSYFVLVTQLGLFDYVENYEMHLTIAPISADIYEPNDSFDTATQLLNDTLQIHNHIPADDVDYFQFNVNEPSTVSIETDGNDGDNQMRLYDSSENSIKYNDDYNGLWAGVQVTLSPGTYTLEISPGYFSDLIKEYSVHLLIIEDKIQIESTSTRSTIESTKSSSLTSTTSEYILDEDITVLAFGGTRREIEIDAKGTLEITIEIFSTKVLDLIVFVSTTYSFGWFDPDDDDPADSLLYTEDITSKIYSVDINSPSTYVVQIINNDFEAKIHLKIKFTNSDEGSGGLPVGLSPLPVLVALLLIANLSILKRKYE
ncbi:MAG: hypothetical protein GPJ54_16960 [Candidatus Heimdallarchaeota archaeon]|nr:hypothetical protein [Candidatus Heimdallarchaeota archaeon]